MNYFERVKKRLDEATLENSPQFEYLIANEIEVDQDIIIYKGKIIPLTENEVNKLYSLGLKVIKRLEKEYEDGYFDDL